MKTEPSQFEIGSIFAGKPNFLQKNKKEKHFYPLMDIKDKSKQQNLNIRGKTSWQRKT